MISPTHLIDTRAAAKLVGLSPRTLETMRVRGGGPKFCRLGSAVRYHPQDLQDWIDANRIASTSEPNA